MEKLHKTVFIVSVERSLEVCEESSKSLHYLIALILLSGVGINRLAFFLELWAAAVRDGCEWVSEDEDVEWGVESEMGGWLRLVPPPATGMVPSYSRLLQHGDNDAEMMFLEDMKPTLHSPQQQQHFTMQPHTNVYYNLQPQWVTHSYFCKSSCTCR